MMVEALRDFRAKREQKREASLVIYAVFFRVVLLLLARGHSTHSTQSTRGAHGTHSPLAVGLMRVPRGVLTAMGHCAVAQRAFPQELDFTDE